MLKSSSKRVNVKMMITCTLIGDDGKKYMGYEHKIKQKKERQTTEIGVPPGYYTKKRYTQENYIKIWAHFVTLIGQSHSNAF